MKPKISKVIILRGIPGSGKSTYAKNYISSHPEEHVIVCSNDSYLIKNKKYNFTPEKHIIAKSNCLKKFIDTIYHNDSTIIVDNTNISLYEMAPYVSIAMAYFVPITLVTFTIPLEVALSRQVHNVPVKTVLEMYSILNNTIGNFPIMWKMDVEIIGNK